LLSKIFYYIFTNTFELSLVSITCPINEHNKILFYWINYKLFYLFIYFGYLISNVVIKLESKNFKKFFGKLNDPIVDTGKLI